MKQVLDYINGKKTYITAILTGAFAVADVLGYPVPEAVYVLLASVFGISLRHAIAKQDA